MRTVSACLRIRTDASRPPSAIASIGTAAPRLYANGRRDRPAAEVLARGGRRDRSEERAGARHEDEAERGTEEEPAARVRRPQAREERERSFEQQARARNEQHRRHHEEQRDREVAQEVLRQAELSSSQDAKSVKTLKLTTSPATIRSGLRPATPPGEQDRQHRQDAGRDRGDDACEETDGDQ